MNANKYRTNTAQSGKPNKQPIWFNDEEWQDEASWHIVAMERGAVVGCLRYTPISASWAWASGWATDGRRGLAVRLVREGVALAARLGRGVMATATVRHGAADVLARMGGVVVSEEWMARTDAGCG